MLHDYYFNNYEGFNKVFGRRKVGEKNGAPVYQRSNNIFFLAYKHALKNGSTDEFTNAFCRVNMASLYSGSFKFLQECPGNYLYMNEKCLKSVEYRLDNTNGLCLDGDFNAIRYIKDDKVYKMKAGKFLRGIAIENGFLNNFCEAHLNYICETFATEWKSYAQSQLQDIKLVVDDDFKYIYSSRNHFEDRSFDSCMVDDNYHSFYSDAVTAKAARLIHSSGGMLARCILYMDVYNASGDKYRLAERQYSAGSSEVYKQMLVDMLIQGGYIDGYKKVGAGCHDSTAFVKNDGEPLSEELYILCNLESGDTLSYQDSFKYYNCDNGRAYNHESCYHTHELTETEGTFERNEDRNYDEFNDEYTDDDITTILVYFRSRNSYSERTCSERYAQNNLFYSEYHGYYLTNGYYSELLEDYLRWDEYDDIEYDWKKDNWEYDEYNEEYCEETMSCKIWEDGEYVNKKVEYYYAKNNFTEYNGDYYNEINETTELPYGTEVEETVEA